MLFFPLKLFDSYHISALFYRFFENLSYNLFFKWIFYFIAPLLFACLALFLNQIKNFMNSTQAVYCWNLTHLDSFELVSIAINKMTVTVSKLLKLLILRQKCTQKPNLTFSKFIAILRG
jgi:hypothetical protein